MVGGLGFLECNDINHIKYEAKDACCKDKPVSFQCAIDRRRECADTFTYRDQKGLPFVGASFPEHGEVHQAHGNVLQIGGIFFTFDASEMNAKKNLQDKAGCKCKDAPRNKPLLLFFAAAVGFSKFEMGVDDHTVQKEPTGVGDRLCADASPNKKVGKGIQPFPCDIQSQSKQRHCAGLLLETNADAVNVDCGPADSADNDQGIDQNVHDSSPPSQSAFTCFSHAEESPFLKTPLSKG